MRRWRRGTRRRVVLATSVAESSLTVPGVRVVVDAGLAREPRTDHARGLGALVTVRVSRRPPPSGRDGPDGRVRGGSTAAGRPPAHDRLAEHAQPEVAVADLTGFALELACWGHPDGAGLALPDPPPAAAMQVARTTLTGLGALDPEVGSPPGVGPSPRSGRIRVWLGRSSTGPSWWAGTGRRR